MNVIVCSTLLLTDDGKFFPQFEKNFLLLFCLLHDLMMVTNYRGSTERLEGWTEESSNDSSEISIRAVNHDVAYIVKSNRRQSRTTNEANLNLFLSLSTQTSLRHPECTYSKENRDTVFCQMRRAMDLIHYVVKDGVLETSNDRSVSRQVRVHAVSEGGASVCWSMYRFCYNLDHVYTFATLIPLFFFCKKTFRVLLFYYVQVDKFSLLLNKQQTIEWDSERATAFTCLKHFSRLVEMARPRFDRAVPHQQASSLPSASTAQGTGK